MCKVDHIFVALAPCKHCKPMVLVGAYATVGAYAVGQSVL